MKMVDSTLENCGSEGDLSCGSCELHRELICREDRGERRLFVLSQLPFFFLSFSGMGAVGAATGVWWPLLAYSMAGVAFLGPVGMAALCRHCPHYSRGGTRLRCIGPNPFPKLFSPRLQPMSGFERGVVILFIALILLFPIVVQGYGAWQLSGRGPAPLGIALAGLGTALAALHLLRTLNLHFCPRCVNFSCPLNRAPKALIDRYLEKNPLVGAAMDTEGR